MRYAALSLAAFAGCFTPPTTTCADGTTCPTSTVCDPQGGGCVDPTLVHACVGFGEGTNCAAVPFGVCQRGACEQTTWQATATAVTASPAPSATGVAVDANGNVYFADAGGQIVDRVDAATGAVTAVAGSGTAGFSGDGGPAANAQLDFPSGVALDGAGNLYIGDTGNGRIRRVDASTGVITTIAGTGDFGFGGDDGPATSASFRFVSPTGLAVDGVGNVYVADTGNHIIREIAGTTVTTIAGTPQTLGFFGDCYSGEIRCPATSAELYQPHAVTRCGNSDLFIADTGNNRVRRVTADGNITTVLGDGTSASSGEGAPANIFPVDSPEGLECDEIGNLFVTSTTAVRMVLADDTGVVGGIANAARTIYASDTPGASTACLTGLVVVDTTHVQVTDSCSGMLMELQRQRLIPR
jgi:sugar lactone lactonase YvrE